MADLATLQARLAEAEAAQHMLLLGDKEVSVAYGAGNLQVSFSRADAASLAAYITQLKAQIGALGGAGGVRRRAILVEF